MRAMIFNGSSPVLKLNDVPIPKVGFDEVLIRVKACGLCRTDLHIIDGDLTDPTLPLILGHQIVGIVQELGSNASSFSIGDHVGVGWLASSCDQCHFCLRRQENLCGNAQFTGYHRHGGLAEFALSNSRACYLLPRNYDFVHAAPLMCAGLISYRAYRMAGDAHHIGFYGFGSAAHILIQIAVADGRKVFAFTKPHDVEAQKLAQDLGAFWVGASTDTPPVMLDAAIIFASAGELVPVALSHVDKGGVVVCAGIHMSDIPQFPYELLWGERSLRSVANLTRDDGELFLAQASRTTIKTQVTTFPLERTNDAITQLRAGSIAGSVVITMD